MTSRHPTRLLPTAPPQGSGHLIFHFSPASGAAPPAGSGHFTFHFGFACRTVLRRSALPAFIALWALTTAACDDTTVPTRPDPTLCELVAVASDYTSTAVSLLYADGTPCAPDVLTSGSRPPGLLTALSGDVVLPSSPSPDAHLHLIDRFPNAVLTVVATDTATVQAQTRLSPDFVGNPQDLTVFPDADILLISRLEYDSRSSDIGSDLAIFRRSDLSPLGRVDLAAFADDGLDPMPTRFAEANNLIWVGLTHLSRDFTTSGPGRILALARDESSFTVVARGELPDLQNCGHIASPPTKDVVWVVCSGLFRDSVTPRIERSGLARFISPPIGTPSAQPATLTPDRLVRAYTLGRPLAFSLAPLTADTVAAILLGDLVEGTPDRLVLITTSPDSAPIVTTLAEGTTFDLGGLLYLAESSMLLMADGNRYTPRLRRFDLNHTPPLELAPVTVSPTGLPPRHLQRIRPGALGR